MPQAASGRVYGYTLHSCGCRTLRTMKMSQAHARWTEDSLSIVEMSAARVSWWRQVAHDFCKVGI